MMPFGVSWLKSGPLSPVEKWATCADTYPELTVACFQVEANFARCGLLDDRVHFLEGWFGEALPTVATTHGR